MEGKEKDLSLLNKKIDNGSSYWKKKYTLLLKRTENVEKQNLRFLNRLYQIKKISQRLVKEKRFLMKRLDSHNDGYKKVQFYQSLALCDVLHESVNYMQTKPVITRTTSIASKNINKNKLKRTGSGSTKKKYVGPKKPLNAFLWFCNEQREIILRQNPGMNHQELTKQMSITWNTLDEDDKKAYYDMFDQDKMRYEREMKEYLKEQQKQKEEQEKQREEQEKVEREKKLAEEEKQRIEKDIADQEMNEAVECLQDDFGEEKDEEMST